MKTKKTSSMYKNERSKVSRKFQFFIWNESIHMRFTILLVFTTFLLATVGYVQSVKIDQLNNQLELRPAFDETIDYNYDIISLDEFFKGENEVPESLSTIYKYLIDNNYEKIYLSKGFVEGEIVKDCKIESRKLICQYELIRFNQKKGKYLEIITRTIEKE